MAYAYCYNCKSPKYKSPNIEEMVMQEWECDVCFEKNDLDKHALVLFLEELDERISALETESYSK
jgi:hypothetical protein